MNEEQEYTEELRKVDAFTTVTVRVPKSKAEPAEESKPKAKGKAKDVSDGDQS